MITLLKKHREILLYTVFGVLTTGINIATYTIFYSVLKIENVPSNLVAWVAAVSFAFITNKRFVFGSNSMEKKILLREAGAFFSCRIATGILDVGIMFVAVDIFSWNALWMKIITNVLVIILNYLASKLLIFKKEVSKSTKD